VSRIKVHTVGAVRKKVEESRESKIEWKKEKRSKGERGK
jgi:hypothetical protein